MGELGDGVGEGIGGLGGCFPGVIAATLLILLTLVLAAAV